MTKNITGYLVRNGKGEIIGATGDEREAIYIARNFKGIVFKIVTTVSPLDNPKTVQTIAYNGLI